MNYIEKILVYKGISYLNLSYANILVILIGLYLIGRTAYKTKKIKHTTVMIAFVLIIISLFASIYSSHLTNTLPLWFAPQMVIPVAILVVMGVLFLSAVQRGSAKISRLIISFAISTALSGGYMYVFAHASSFVFAKYLPFIPQSSQVVQSKVSALSNNINNRITSIENAGGGTKNVGEITYGKVGDGVPTQSLVESVLSDNVKKQLGSSFLWNRHGAIVVNDNKSDLKANVSSAPYATNTPVDSKGRLGVANAWLNKSSRQYKNRNETGNAKTINPAGYLQKKVGSEYLYNRGHLLGYALVGNIKGFDASEANRNNIATQTEWANQAQSADDTGQNYYEGLVRKALDSNKKVRYRVTPIYDGGVVPVGNHIEAKSKDGSLQFNVFVPNVEPAVQINYLNGSSIIK